MTPGEVKQIANMSGWRFVKPIPKSKSTWLRFKRMTEWLEIDPESMLVKTTLYHPRFKARFGATTLLRQNITEKELRLLFNYPRLHTDKGIYIIKRSNN